MIIGDTGGNAEGNVGLDGTESVRIQVSKVVESMLPKQSIGQTTERKHEIKKLVLEDGQEIEIPLDSVDIDSIVQTEPEEGLENTHDEHDVSQRKGEVHHDEL